MLQTEAVAYPPQGKGGMVEVAELPGVVQGDGVVIHVRVNVGLVGMGADQKGVLALRPPHAELVAYRLGLFRGDFAGEEGLPDLVAENIRVGLLLPARDGLILGLG